MCLHLIFIHSVSLFVASLSFLSQTSANLVGLCSLSWRFDSRSFLGREKQSDRLREAVITIIFFFFFSQCTCIVLILFVVSIVLAAVSSSPFVCVCVFFLLLLGIGVHTKILRSFKESMQSEAGAAVSRVCELCPSQNSGRKLVSIGLHGSGNLGM